MEKIFQRSQLSDAFKKRVISFPQSIEGEVT